jgi:hypothetical protein
LFTGVNHIGDKFFAGAVDTAEQLITGVTLICEFLKKIQKGSNGILGGLGDTDS